MNRQRMTIAVVRTHLPREASNSSRKKWGILLIMALVFLGWGRPAAAEIAENDLLGEWCVVSQTLNGHDIETVLTKLSSKLKAKVGQSYQFNEDQTVKITLRDDQEERFSFKVAGKKNNRIRIFRKDPGKKYRGRMERWDSFTVKSLTSEEMTAKVLGVVQHRFTHGACK